MPSALKPMAPKNRTTQVRHQFNLKRVCPSLSFNWSSRDILVTGVVAWTLILGAGSLFTVVAARWVTFFFTGPRFTRLCFFGTPSAPFGGVVLGRGFVSTALATGHRSENSSTLGGEGGGGSGRTPIAEVILASSFSATIVGKSVSISTRSGNCSAELILMTGRSISLRTGSERDCGKYQLSPNSSRARALPANPKYFSKGI